MCLVWRRRMCPLLLQANVVFRLHGKMVCQSSEPTWARKMAGQYLSLPNMPCKILHAWCVCHYKMTGWDLRHLLELTQAHFYKMNATLAWITLYCASPNLLLLSNYLIEISSLHKFVPMQNLGWKCLPVITSKKRALLWVSDTFMLWNVKAIINSKQMKNS